MEDSTLVPKLDRIGTWEGDESAPTSPNNFHYLKHTKKWQSAGLVMIVIAWENIEGI
jgi:hypothetical protein